MTKNTKKAGSRRLVPVLSALTPDGLQFVWIPLKIACERTGFSRSTLLRIIGDERNGIKTVLIRSHPENQSGKLFVHTASLLEFFDRQARTAKEAASSLEGAAK
jgi:hypothetical protein